MNKIIYFILISYSVLFNSCKEEKKQEKKEIPKTKHTNLFFDLETKKYTKQLYGISNDKSLSGQKSIHVDEPNSFSTTFEIPTEELDTSQLNKVRISFWVYPTVADFKSVFVLSMKDSTHTQKVYWSGTYIENANRTTNEWFPFSVECQIPDSAIQKASIANFYIWHQDSSTVYFDDFFISLGDDKKEAPSYFENYENADFARGNLSKNAHLGHSGLVVNANQSVSFINTKSINQLENSVNTISISGWIYPKYEKVKGVFNFKIIDSTGYIHYWRQKPINNLQFTKEKWTKIAFDIPLLNSLQHTDCELICELQNKEELPIYLDDIYIHFKEINQDLLFSYCDLSKGDFANQELKNHPPYCDFLMKVSDIKPILSNDKEHLLTANFTLNNEGATLKIEKDGNWKIIKNTEIISGNFNLFLGHNNQTNTYYNGDYISEKEGDEVLQVITNDETGNTKFRIFYFDKKEKQFQAWFSEKQKYEGIYTGIDTLKKHQNIYPVNLKEYGKCALVIDNEKLLHIKLIKFNSIGFDVIGKISFEDFQKGRNPKFYDSIKVHFGNFIPDAEFSLMLSGKSPNSEKLPDFSRIYYFRS